MNLSEAIKKLKSENELCLENREGECGGYNYKDCKCYCAGSIIVRALEEYIKIGTVEECREARERQRGKKVSNRTLLRDLNGNPYTVRGDCPNCGSINLVSTNTDYCNVCGQKLDWSDTP